MRRLRCPVREALDFVTLNSSPPNLQQKTIIFQCEILYFSWGAIVDLAEINSLVSQDILCIRNISQRPALYLCDLIKKATFDNRETHCKYLSKLFNVAHSLLTTSSGLEQSFSTLKLLKNDNQNSLLEAKIGRLIMIKQAFKEGEIEIFKELVELFEDLKDNINC